MVIGDQQFVTLLFYLDDICIFANSADQMLDQIELVFSRLQQYQLKIKPEKSFFFQTEVSFLGHVLSAKGISPNPEKVDKVRDWPFPKTSKEVHSFISLASYYRRFIPNFAKWSKPLNALIVPPAHQAKVRRDEMKKSELTEFLWSKECQEGFDALKHALTSSSLSISRLFSTFYSGNRCLFKRSGSSPLAKGQRRRSSRYHICKLISSTI